MYIRYWTEKVDIDEPQLGSQSVSELMEEPGEGEQVFYQSWADEGYSATAYTIDDYSDEMIELNASTYFTEHQLAWIEEVLDDAITMGIDHTAESIQIALKLQGTLQ